MFSKTTLFTVLLFGTLTANAQLLGTKGLRFVAPQVDSKANVGNPETGEIVFDMSSNSGQGEFWGYNAIGSWVSLTGGTSTPIAPTI